jgi:hypothetical protein
MELALHFFAHRNTTNCTPYSCRWQLYCTVIYYRDCVLILYIVGDKFQDHITAEQIEERDPKDSFTDQLQVGRRAMGSGDTTSELDCFYYIALCWFEGTLLHCIFPICLQAKYAL